MNDLILTDMTLQEFSTNNNTGFQKLKSQTETFDTNYQFLRRKETLKYR